MRGGHGGARARGGLCYARNNVKNSPFYVILWVVSGEPVGRRGGRRGGGGAA